MTRIGFAYNQKPEQPALIGNKATAHQNSVEDGELSRLQNEISANDEFAEWDSKETIDAVAAALSALGAPELSNAVPADRYEISPVSTENEPGRH